MSLLCMRWAQAVWGAVSQPPKLPRHSSLRPGRLVHGRLVHDGRAAAQLPASSGLMQLARRCQVAGSWPMGCCQKWIG